MKKVTVYDVARELGLSSATVSRVLNNSVLVSGETRRRILESAERLGYVKRAIRRQEARTIPTVALFLPHASNAYRQLFYDPSELIESLAGAFAPTRVNIVTAVAGQDLEAARKLGGVDGCVFAFLRPDPALAASLNTQGIPFVVLNRTGPDFAWVSCDHGAGMAKLVARLRVTGRVVRPFYLGLLAVPEISRLRLAALGTACATTGLPFGPADAREVPSLAEVTPALLRSLVDAGHTALVCFNDLVAIAALNAARAAGVRVPEDLMMTGFDHTPVMAVSPLPIDTIDLEVVTLGRTAARWLRERILTRGGEPIAQAVAGRYVPGKTISSEVLRDPT